MEILRCLCFCVIAATGWVCAAEPAPIPQPNSLLVDQVGVLSDAERAALLARLQTIQTSGRAQIAMLISSGTGGAPLADYALQVAEGWQLGRAGRDDGLLVLVVPSAAAVRLEVGYGLEGAIPDARASQWIDELLPAVAKKELARGLDRLLDRIEGVLPETAAKTDENYLFPDHPEWRLPFVLVVFSPFALFPMFAGRWGSFASALLLAGFYGGAAWALWNSGTAAAAVAGAAFLLPLLWGLNWFEGADLAPWLRYARTLGNLIAVALFFCVITLFVGAGLSGADVALWPAPLFAGLLATGVAVFLFPGKAAEYLMVVLRSAMHFVFILVVAYVALLPFRPEPLHIALAVAAAVTACAALGLYLDSRERARGSAAHGEIRWSLWFFGLALLLALPFGVLALFMAMGGEDFQTQLTQAAAGGGSITGILALAARYGLFAAVRIGLGGRFGGGGAGRSE
jgi:uncharacterized protein